MGLTATYLLAVPGKKEPAGSFTGRSSNRKIVFYKTKLVAGSL